MKNYSFYKTAQLIIFLLLAVIVILLFVFNPDLFHAIANDTELKSVSLLLWAALALSFAFLYLDFSYFLNYRKEYREMEKAAGTDPFSGIANRFSCDTVIDRYYGKQLDPGFGCVMFDLKGIQTIDRSKGNELIRSFSMILRLSSKGLCFVGRNGGIKFMALFETGGEASIKLFLDRVREHSDDYNSKTEDKIGYVYGFATEGSDETGDITRLISLANSRIS